MTVLKFFTISFVVFPLLPDREIIRGLNPSEVWKFVILVSSVDFVGYFLLKYKGTGSLILTALIGGIPSSTAVTMAFSNLSRKFSYLSELFFFSIILSWLVMFFRVIFYTFIIFEGMIYKLVLLLLPYFALLLMFAIFLYLKGNKNHEEGGSMSIKNPFSLSQAFTFGLIYSTISVISHYLKTHFGDEGIYVLSFLSGIMDIDAITLLLARLSDKGEIGVDVAAMGILLAVMSNNLFKSGYAIIFGSKKLKIYFLFVALFTLIYTTTLLILFDKLHMSS
ncbi:MgtC/SapB family protein [Aquifex aeolicus]|uniref:MgtC/SapB family protein n=1 Tax=Aquifex aeolicus TaxID=63363 RepID=UPI0030833D16